MSNLHRPNRLQPAQAQPSMSCPSTSFLIKEKAGFMMKRLLAISLLGILVVPVCAAGNRADYDLDDDGLIEINDLADLNEIRNSQDGKKLYNSSTGCPTTGCNGFELTTDLNFDTNNDGVMSASDTYWNAGQGWVPISEFQAIFDGNGFAINNLMINRPTSRYQGLFGEASSAVIRRLAFKGMLTSVTSSGYAGLLAGGAYTTEIQGIFATGNVVSPTSSNAGGLVGYSNQVQMRNIYSAVNVTSSPVTYFGNPTLHAASVLIAGYIQGQEDTTDGLAGKKVALTNSYWITDTTGKTKNDGFGGTGATLAQLQCPAAVNNANCLTGQTLYKDWDLEKDMENKPYWQFEAGKLPALVLKGKVYRDSDGDGFLDADDKWPSLYAAAIDTDNDGAPDKWALNCDANCRTASGLILDQFPNDSAATADLDMDGIADNVDSYPNDTDNDGIPNLQDTDDNNDGQPDADADSDGLIDIETWAELDAIRHNLKGTSQRLTANGVEDNSGCPIRIVDGVAILACEGYELLNNLDFDTNNDNALDASDVYWNGGGGWVAIGSESNNAFTAIFEGNGFVIRNLMINRPSSVFQGLFGYIKDATIRHLGVTGPMTSIKGSSWVGIFTGVAGNNSNLIGVFATGSVEASSSSGKAGGLVGSGGQVRNAFAAVIVKSTDVAGGAQGTGVSLTSVFAVGSVSGNQGGGLTGSFGSFTNSYWATDTTGQLTSSGGGTGRATLAQLQCPAASNNTNCLTGQTLYKDWDLEKDMENKPYWQFEAGKLPALVLKGKVYRDSDGDGFLDADDKWPSLYAAAIDTDNDGAPDKWALNCDANCRTASGLILDQFPNDSAATADLDMDGIADNVDSYPNDTDNDGIPNLQDTDDNNDGQPDADADSDGLIDIETWAELDAIRHNLKGTSQRLTANGVEDNSGCPIRIVDGVAILACEGYELLNDLNFDTNNDNTLDASDAYWNGGGGWVAIGSGSNNAFTAIFEGNGFAIRNLMIDRSTSDIQGLFGYTNKASIRRLSITGPLMSIKGNNFVGSLVGISSTTQISGVFATGSVQAATYVGGVLGYASSHTSLRNIFSGVKVQGNTSGGVVGYGIGLMIASSYAVGLVTGTSNLGGLVGSSGSITNSYWATDTSGQLTAKTGEVGATLAQLKCPTSANNTSCLSGTTLYKDWDLEKDGDAPYWYFGTDQELPALVIKGKVYRDNDADNILDTVILPPDSDNDGVWDTQDPFPNNPAASIDSDGDGYPDSWNTSCNTTCQLTSNLVLDSFPAQVAAAIDTDNDGAPDNWNSGCNLSCQISSRLKLDAFPNNPAASVDTDNDGSPNEWNVTCDSICQTSSGLKLDAFPTKVAAAIDTDNDNSPDAWNQGCNTDCQRSSGLIVDVFPTNPAVARDTDGDGAPDSWNSSCNSSCRSSSDLKLDAFPEKSAAAIDEDQDGKPDLWAVGCDSTCQDLSGLTLDFYLNDKDNDGVLDSLDSDNSRDNGKPFVLAVPQDINIAATGILTPVTLAQTDVVVTDAVDTSLDIKVMLKGQVLALDDNQVQLPSGALKLQWIAVDDAGNKSEPVEQVVNIYPQVEFAVAEQVTGEKSTGSLALKWSGNTPIFPVSLTFKWIAAESTATQDDASTNLQSLNVTIADEDSLATAALNIGILGDTLAENTETLSFELISAKAGLDQGFDLPIGNQAKTFLTITEFNLAPEVDIELIQKEKVVTQVVAQDGLVSVKANLVDLNGNDLHSYEWLVDGLPATPDNKVEFVFDPLELSGKYSITVKVTDNGNPPMTDESVKEFEIVSTSNSSSSSSAGWSSISSIQSSSSSSIPRDSNSSSSSLGNASSISSAGVNSSTPSGGKSGGGRLDLIWLMGLILLMLFPRRQSVDRLR